jgi:hypothetical protein
MPISGITKRNLKKINMNGNGIEIGNGYGVCSDTGSYEWLKTETIR